MCFNRDLQPHSFDVSSYISWCRVRLLQLEAQQMQRFSDIELLSLGLELRSGGTAYGFLATVVSHKVLWHASKSNTEPSWLSLHRFRFVHAIPAHFMIVLVSHNSFHHFYRVIASHEDQEMVLPYAQDFRSGWTVTKCEPASGQEAIALYILITFIICLPPGPKQAADCFIHMIGLTI